MIRLLLMAASALAVVWLARGPAAELFRGDDAAGSTIAGALSQLPRQLETWRNRPGAPLPLATPEREQEPPASGQPEHASPPEDHVPVPAEEPGPEPASPPDEAPRVESADRVAHGGGDEMALQVEPHDEFGVDLPRATRLSAGEAEAIRSRLDRVMALAAGSGR